MRLFKEKEIEEKEPEEDSIKEILKEIKECVFCRECGVLVKISFAHKVELDYWSSQETHYYCQAHKPDYDEIKWSPFEQKMKKFKKIEIKNNEHTTRPLKRGNKNKSKIR